MNALAPIDHKPLIAQSSGEIRSALAMLFVAYPEPWSERNADRADELHDAKISAYMLGLHGLPGWSVESAVADFIQGKIDRPQKRRGTLPTVEELAAEARSHRDREASKTRAEHVRQEQIAERSDAQPTDRMKFFMAVWRASLARNDGGARVARAIEQGISTKHAAEEMMALGQEWSVPIPESMWADPAPVRRHWE